MRNLIRKILKESKEDFSWVKSTEPRISDIRQFNKDRYNTTLDYSSVSVGDRFLPPNGHIVWTIDDMYNISPVNTVVVMMNEKGKKRYFSIKYPNKISRNFPKPYKPWKKVSSVNESLDWVLQIGNEWMGIQDDLEARIKSLDWDVEYEWTYERTEQNGYYFGRLWCGDDFYELYQYDNTFTIRIYGQMEHRGRIEYHQYDAYEDLSREDLMLKVTQLIVGCLDKK